MNQPVRLAISGASGRMGTALIGCSRGDRRVRVTRAVIDAASDLVGKPVQQPSTPESLRFSAGWADAAGTDVVIDFSTPQGLEAALEYCLANASALVIGTTGFDAGLRERIRDAAERIAVLQASNFSLGMAVLQHLLQDAARALPEWDLEIIEAHHGRKEDAPSGTALSLAEAAAKARGVSLDEHAVYTHQGHPGARSKGAIGFSVIRAGDIVGEHTALLAGPGERIELSHRATDRGIFARGAMEAAIWLSGRTPGLYGIGDVLEERIRRPP